MGFAREAGALLLEHFRRPLEIEYKSEGHRDPVTEADRHSEDFLRRAIGDAYPDHGIVGEEQENSEHAAPDFVWVLDPLDGTNNFMNGLPVFACSIGVLYRGKPVATAIFIPDPGGASIYHARLGGGAFQDDRPLAVTPNSQPERGRLTGLPSYYWAMYGFRDGLRRRIGEIRSLGSAVYEIVLVARGSMQLCVLNAPKVWDVAGAVLLVQEAGGEVLTRRPGSQQWEPFISFVAEGASLEQIYNWRGPIMAGNAEVIRYAGERIWARSRRWFRFRRWLAQKRAGLRSRKTGSSEQPERSRR